MQLSKDTVQITVRAPGGCGMEGAQRVAMRRTAIETIAHGYDSFMIFGANAQTDTAVVGYTPTYATTNAYGYGNYATANTTVTGGYPMFAQFHGQAITVKMFKEGDPAAANALPARPILGADWQKIVAEEAKATQAQC